MANELKHVSIHGHEVGYRMEGEGSAILLIHGIAGSSTAWRDVVPALAQQYTVIAPDLIGHGQSAKPLGDYSLGAYASGMRDLLRVLGVPRATIVGQSFGGGVALQLAYQHPELCERLVLVDSGGLGREVSWLLRFMTLPGSEYLDVYKRQPLTPARQASSSPTPKATAAAVTRTRSAASRPLPRVKRCLLYTSRCV